MSSSRLASALLRGRAPLLARPGSAAAPQLAAAAPRRFAGAAFAHLKVKKNNSIEQNEVFRENQFMTWEARSTNLVWLALLLGLPLGFRELYMGELAMRDAEHGRPVHERV